jgi:hypothetical protein
LNEVMLWPVYVGYCICLSRAFIMVIECVTNN